MSGRRKIELSCITVTIHPDPTEEKYKALFDMLYTRNKKYKYYGDKIAFIEKELERSDDIYTGEVARVTDSSGIFYNMHDGKPLIDEEGNPITVFDTEKFKANFKHTTFIFFPKEHRFIFDVRDFPPKTMLKILQGLVDLLDYKDGEITLILEKDRDTLEKIKGLAIINKLTIEFTLPNGDSMSKDVDILIKSFDKRGVQSHSQEQRSRKDSKIEMDAMTEGMLDISRSYGNASVIGKDSESSRNIKYSTKELPMIKSYPREKKILIRDDIIKRAKEFLKAILK